MGIPTAGRAGCPFAYRARAVRAAAVAAGLVALTAAHVTVPPDEHEVHALLFNVAFVPLILAGPWLGVRGALVARVLTGAVSLVHLLGQLAPLHALGPWSTVGLVVEDEGAGIPDSMVARILDPFVTTRPDGSGLGLAIAHRLAASMGGGVELVASGAGGGTFRVSLPRAAVDRWIGATAVTGA